MMYFVLAIFVISIIRLGLLFMGDSEDKVTKFTQWIIGMIMIIISWYALGKVWGINTSLKLGENNKIELQDKSSSEDKKNEGTEINLTPEQ